MMRREALAGDHHVTVVEQDQGLCPELVSVIEPHRQELLCGTCLDTGGVVVRRIAVPESAMVLPNDIITPILDVCHRASTISIDPNLKEKTCIGQVRAQSCSRW